MTTATDLLVWGMAAHLVVDWLFQNHWMAENKADLRHPAGYVHAGLHTLALLLVFPAAAAAVLGVLHLLIDTRRPLAWWRRFFRQTGDGPAALHVAIWADQVLHIAAIAAAALSLKPL
jgi:hypothetical protein